MASLFFNKLYNLSMLADPPRINLGENYNTWFQRKISVVWVRNVPQSLGYLNTQFRPVGLGRYCGEVCYWGGWETEHLPHFLFILSALCLQWSMWVSISYIDWTLAAYCLTSLPWYIHTFRTISQNKFSFPKVAFGHDVLLQQLNSNWYRDPTWDYFSFT